MKDRRVNDALNGLLSDDGRLRQAEWHSGNASILIPGRWADSVTAEAEAMVITGIQNSKYQQSSSALCPGCLQFPPSKKCSVHISYVV